MTTIPQIATAMHQVFTIEAERAGRQSGMVRRSDAKRTGSTFTQLLVFGLGTNSYARLCDVSQTAAACGISVRAEAIHQRFDRQAASCREQVVYAAMRQVLTANPVVVPAC